ncbi:MAG: hypothetical protein AAGA77_05485 [Bacteroidota bacterium]
MKTFFALGVVLLLFSCQDNFTDTNNTPVNGIENREGGGEQKYSAFDTPYSKTQARALFSQALATAIGQNPAVKDYIVAKAAEEFAGDTEILYAMVKDDEIEGGSFGQILQEAAMSSEMQVTDDFFTNTVVASDPYLTVYVDERYYDNPDLVNRPVTVAYQTAELDDSETPFYNGFTQDGVPVEVVDYTEEEMLIGIKEHENIILVETTTWKTANAFFLFDIMGILCPGLQAWIAGLQFEIFIQGKTYKIVQLIMAQTLYNQLCLDSDGDGIIDVNDDCPTQPGPASNNGCPVVVDPPCTAPNCDRTNNPGKKDRVHNFKFVSCAAYKSTSGLFEGNREMRASFAFATASSPIVIHKDGSYSKGSLRSANWLGKCKSTKWVNAGWETLDWDYCTHGEEAKVIWIERDAGDIATVKLSFKFKIAGVVDTGINVDIPIKDNDDLLGESLLQYCDPATGGQSNYNTGSITFNYGL